MKQDTLILLIQNLRRGDDMERSKELFFREMSTKGSKWCKELSLRWLISVIDTYADHGTELEQSNAMIVSTFANLIKIADTKLLLTKYDYEMLPRLKENVVRMYDDLNSLMIQGDDMPNNLWFRIDEKLEKTPEIKLFFEEIKERFRKLSPMLTISRYSPHFWEKRYFQGRRNFKGL